MCVRRAPTSNRLVVAAGLLTHINPRTNLVRRVASDDEGGHLQPIQPAEIARQSTNLFSATEVAETIGADLETINAWLEVGAIDRAIFGGGRFSKYELQRAALTFELVKFGLSPPSARDVVWEMEHDLQQIWAGTISNQYKAYAIIIPNNQKKWLLIWCWKVSTEEIDPSSQSHIILPISDILARVSNDTEQACQH